MSEELPIDFSGHATDLVPRVPFVRVVTNLTPATRELREQLTAEISFDGSCQITWVFRPEDEPCTALEHIVL